MTDLIICAASVAGSARIPKGTIDPRPGLRLAEIRRDRNLTQEQLAETIGVTATTLQHWERGRVKLTTDAIARCAAALRCRMADLLMSPGSPMPRRRRGSFP